MKNSILVTAAVIFFSTAHAQVKTNTSLKNDINVKNKQEVLLKREVRKDRKELRKINSSEASYQAKQQFISDFGDVPAKWDKASYFDIVSFKKDGGPVQAYYDYDAKLVGTTTDKKITDLPSIAQKFIKDKYNDYRVAQVIEFDDNAANESDMMLFNQQFDDEDSYFVELKKPNDTLVLQIDTEGDVYYFTDIK
ncbi:MAG: hypothetical protein ABI315_12560 [Bacteroidia bacterium]